MNIELLIRQLSDVVVGLPLMLFVVGISMIYTVALRGIQFRHFFTAWKATLFPSTKGAQLGQMSPFQAFINTVNSNLGNGSIAGMGTAIYAGGPGAALWVVIFGFVLMAIRFAEVYVSALYGMRQKSATGLGGPMLYLKDVPGGSFLPYLYAICCMFFGLLGGNAMQANSIQVSLTTTWGISPYVSGIVLFCFVLYILLGGADRIVAISLSIVPIKVAVFLISSFGVLGYHYQAIPAALCTIFSNAFNMSACVGGLAGFALQQIIRAGMTQSIFATESGLGSAAILFGSTGSNDPIQSGFMGMVSTFISTFVAFIVGLCIVVSGVWGSGLASTALTISAFNTVFGNFGGWIVSFLSVSFGFGVLVSYAYIARMIWSFLTNDCCPKGFVVVYSLCTLVGAISSVGLVWSLIDIAVAVTLFINLSGLLFLLPKIRRELVEKLRHYQA